VHLADRVLDGVRGLLAGLRDDAVGGAEGVVADGARVLAPSWRFSPFSAAFFAVAASASNMPATRSSVSPSNFISGTTRASAASCTLRVLTRPSSFTAGATSFASVVALTSFARRFATMLSAIISGTFSSVISGFVASVTASCALSMAMVFIASMRALFAASSWAPRSGESIFSPGCMSASFFAGSFSASFGGISSPSFFTSSSAAPWRSCGPSRAL
jgi:hypothetical protein